MTNAGLFFEPEVGGSVLLRNVGLLPADHTALHPRREVFITTAVRTSNPTFKIIILSVVLHQCETYPDVSRVKGKPD
jgi:hypothetical protein